MATSVHVHVHDHVNVHELRPRLTLDVDAVVDAHVDVVVDVHVDVIGSFICGSAAPGECASHCRLDVDLFLLP